MPFTEIQRDLGIVILNKVSQTEREISYDIAFRQNIKKNETKQQKLWLLMERDAVEWDKREGKMSF